jgi:hypothetical protein
MPGNWHLWRQLVLEYGVARKSWHAPKRNFASYN